MAPPSTQAASPPPSRPASPNLPSTNQRNDEVAGDESVPLLPNQDPPRAGVVSAKAMHILTSSAVSSAVCTLLFLIVIAILMSTLPYGYQVPWQTSEAFSAVVPPALGSVLIGTVNLARIRRSRSMSPLALNLLFDFLIALFAISYAASGLGGVVDRYDYGWSQLPIQILAGIAMGMALIFGIIHLALFVVRCRMALLMESWGGPWSLPTGQLTFEVSIKHFKEPQKPSQGGGDAV